MSRELLIIEDDPAVRALASALLEAEGFEVEAFGDAPDPDSVDWERFHVVVLDVGLPTANGFEVCREIRARSTVPVVLLTARDDAADVVAGLDAGADDYVTKPFDSAVLAARARAAARRHGPGFSNVSVRAGDIVVDEKAFRASRAGVELDLTATELRLLDCLVRHAGEVMTRQVLLQEVWGYDYLGDSRLVDMAVLRLRSKLRGVAEAAEDPIVTVRGEGYRIDP